MISRKVKSYDFILNLGSACPATEALRNCGFQVYSFPFDWLYGSDFLDRINIINSDFTNWLNLDDLEHIGEKRVQPLPCNIYKNKKTQIVFNHDFPLSEKLEDSFPFVKQKYERRIKRLFNFIKKSKKILVFYLETAEKNIPVDDKILASGLNILCKKFPNKKIDVLYLLNKQNAKYAEITEVNENIAKVFFSYGKEGENVLPYEVNVNAVCQFLKSNYKRRKFFGEFLDFKIKKIKKRLYKILGGKSK